MNKVIKLSLSILSVLILWGCTKSEFSSTDAETVVTGQSFSWHEGEWEDCSLPCGGGTQSKEVQCRSVKDVVVPDSECEGVKPASQQSCHTQACTASHDWNIGPWGTCNATCGGGTKNRTVRCQDTATGADVAENLCATQKPDLSESCNTQACPADVFHWEIGAWDATCDERCGGKTRSRSVTCQDGSGIIRDESKCSSQQKPTTQETCTNSCNYNYSWTTGIWGTCSKSCDSGNQSRSLGCLRNDGIYVPHTLCPAATKPLASQPCNTQACTPTCTPKQISETVPASENKLDVLLVVDDSGSMAADNAKLANKLNDFMGHLYGSNVDWQMCVTTTDAKYYQGRPLQWQGTNGHILTTNSGNLHNIFTQTMAWIGYGWPQDEQGIKAMNLSVKDNSRSHCYRDGAALAVVIISDEDEMSVGGVQSLNPLQYKPLGSLNTPQSFIDTVNSEFPGGKRLSVHSLIVKDAQCKAMQDAQAEIGSNSYYGTKYHELSNLTGGVVASICTPNFSVCLDQFSTRIIQSMSSVTLQCSPKNGSLDVKVNGLDYNSNSTLQGTQLNFNPVINGPANITGSYCCQQ